MNNILKVLISNPISIDTFERKTVSFDTIDDKEEYLSTLDIFSRRASRTGELEVVVVHVDLWK